MGDRFYMADKILSLHMVLKHSKSLVLQWLVGFLFCRKHSESLVLQWLVEVLVLQEAF